MMYDVAIVGYGPTGATLANLLAGQGISVVILEREEEMYHLPRAVHFDDEVMRVFQTVGIADDLADKVHINPGMKFVDDDDNLLLDWPRPQEITGHGWHASYRLHQPDLEQLLRAKLATEPTAQIVSGFDVQEVESADDHAIISGMSLDTGDKQIFHARYVVGCDGANSMVRQAIGSEMDDLGFEERWLVIDLILKTPRPDLGDQTIQFCNPDRPMTYCRSPGTRRRWEISVQDEETDAEISDPDRVWSLLSRWINPDEAELERCNVYTFRSQIAQTWRSGRSERSGRSGRLLIAGDAAHLTPPFMGQGMCTGIRDAANLGWKLIARLRGADDSLLDSYQQERAPHARAYVETAIHLGGLINSLDRNSALRLAEDQAAGRAKMRSIAPKLGDSCILDTQDDAPESPVGRPFEQLDIGEGQRSFDDKIGYNHLIISHDEPSDLPANTVWLSATKSPAIANALTARQAGAIWVRPDRYIGAIANSTASLKELMPAVLRV